MKAEEFWKEYDIAEKDHRKWWKRADKVLERYRDEVPQNANASFNILWANTEVLQPQLFSRVPKPDSRRRYRDDDPIAREGAKVLERGLEFVMEDNNFYSFGTRSVRDYLLPGRMVSKVRYEPRIARRMERVPLKAQSTLGPDGLPGERCWFTEDGDQVGEPQYDEEGNAFLEQEVEEVVDERVAIERWPWRNFVHQKAKRWEDVQWIDFISYVPVNKLPKMFSPSKAAKIKKALDNEHDRQADKDSSEKPTHAEIHEVWFIGSREVKVGARGLEREWLREGPDPLRYEGFWPTPQPAMAVDTNDSLMPIPLFTLYQSLANELDLITHRITLLMRAIKVAGLYAGSEQDTIKKLLDSDENELVPVADWNKILQAGKVEGLIAWWPVEQIGKVLTFLFQERQVITQQVFELTGLTDIQRGSSDPRETRGAQQLKARFAGQRLLMPQQEVERYFRDVMRLCAEVLAEHFSAETLSRMTGIQIDPQVMQLFKDQLNRQYRIDIETDTLIAEDDEAQQGNLAKALDVATKYMQTVAPMVQMQLVPQAMAIRLLKTYLRKFKFGRDLEEALEEAERQPPPEQGPDPEAQKAQAEMQMKQQEFQMEQAKMQQEMQAEQQQAALRLQADQQKFQQDMQQEQQKFLQDLRQDQEKFAEEMSQLVAKGDEQLAQMREKAEIQKQQARQRPNGEA